MSLIRTLITPVINKYALDLMCSLSENIRNKKPYNSNKNPSFYSVHIKKKNIYVPEASLK